MRYNFSERSGIWTDLAIEQMLMRPIKSSGGLNGGRFINFLHILTQEIALVSTIALSTCSLVGGRTLGWGTLGRETLGWRRQTGVGLWLGLRLAVRLW